MNKNTVIEMMTAMYKKIGWGALAAVVVTAAGCVNEDPVYIDPTGPETAATGYLTMSAIGLYVVADSETDQETEHSPTAMLSRAGAPTDDRTGITRGVEASQEDEYRVTIRSRDAVEPVFCGTYAELKSAISAHEKGLEVPVGVYDISATSNLSEAGAPDDVQSSPSYAGAVEGVSVDKDAATEVGTVVCKLQNIKITVGVSADLYEQLDVLDPEKDPVNKIEAKVYYGEAANPTIEWKIPSDWDWTATVDDAQAVYFPVLNQQKNTLYFSFRARTKDGREIPMTKEISGVLQGQWRRIHVIPRYDTTGNLTFDVQISAFVQENVIVVGDDGSSTKWRELAYVDPDDPSMAAPSLKWADGSALPETIEVGSTAVQAVTIDAPNAIERVGLTFRSTHPEFASDAAAMTVEDLCAVSRNTLLSAYGIPFGDALKGQTAVTFALDGILKEIRNYAGEYTFTFAVTDCAGFTCEQSLRFLCGDGGGAGAPSIVWATGRLYDDDGYRADGTPIAGAPFVELKEGMEIVLQLQADLHFESIYLKITSAVLNEELLAAAGLPTEFDLCDLQDFVYDGDVYTAESQAKVLKENLELIDKVNDELKQEQTASFNITGFVPILKMLGANEQFQFALTVTDAGGRSTTKYLRLQNPAE